eukprot:TRINITY_DN17487_c0_g1_i1.p1 TRINITY_DN17487_c0_g1~~TRINITY_DN17487_c0_g1_i1.p1  ORF type:complete len:308 (+),score=70.86 TRINITY_DN17487_c0_g1_i1:136-1059(+)
MESLRHKLNDAGNTAPTGLPLILFPQTFVPPCDRKPPVNVHDALLKAMGGDGWIGKDYIIPTVCDFVEHSEEVKTVAPKYNISNNEASAIVYYTYDVSSLGLSELTREDNIYKKLNSILCKRNMSAIDVWRDFLFYFISGLEKLPSCNKTVFRALDVPLCEVSKQYKEGNQVVWVGLTSTSCDREVVDSFINEKEKKGTFISIEAIEAKDISSFSYFPNEKELLLLPNATFLVESILTDKMKELMKFSKSIDGLILKQKPTPLHLTLRSTSRNNVTILEKEKQESKTQVITWGQNFKCCKCNTVFLL